MDAPPIRHALVRKHWAEAEDLVKSYFVQKYHTMNKDAVQSSDQPQNQLSSNEAEEQEVDEDFLPQNILREPVKWIDENGNEIPSTTTLSYGSNFAEKHLASLGENTFGANSHNHYSGAAAQRIFEMMTQKSHA